MKLKTLEELKQVAEVRPPLARDRMSKRQRLERWAEVLELAPQRYLRSLFETEYMSPQRRYALREDTSPLTVAFEDSVLRVAGVGVPRGSLKRPSSAGLQFSTKASGCVSNHSLAR